MDSSKSRILIAELFGTCVLMLGGPGSAIFAARWFVPGDDTVHLGIGLLGVSLAFGFTLALLAYVIGPISGCHVNPAVTLGLLVSKKIDKAHATAAVIGQIIGGILGGGILAIIVASAGNWDSRGGFASNGYDKPRFMGLGAAAIIEVVLTALLVIVVLATTTKKFAPGFGGLVAGLTLAVIHLISIPIDNTSVNPARSIGAAIFADGSTDALKQLWAFIVFPLIGGALGAAIHKVLHGADA
jgi:aquaporin Z